MIVVVVTPAAKNHEVYEEFAAESFVAVVVNYGLP